MADDERGGLGVLNTGALEHLQFVLNGLLDKSKLFIEGCAMTRLEV